MAVLAAMATSAVATAVCAEPWASLTMSATEAAIDDRKIRPACGAHLASQELCSGSPWKPEDIRQFKGSARANILA